MNAKLALSLAAAALLGACAAPSAVTPAGSAPAAHGSWMKPQKNGAKSILVYATDDQTGVVNVYDYANGEQVGTIDEFILSGCVDAVGNVYLVRFSGASVDEYAHGGTQPIQTFSPGGELSGCSVDSKGDVAITGTTPGAVTIYPHGDPTRGQSYSNTECETQASMGYDSKRAVIGLGQYDTVSACAVLARAKQETTLSTSGITIYAPDGTMWDGKYIALSDEEAQHKNLTGIYQATLSGTTLTAASETILTDPCYRGETSVLNPFILGSDNTPANHRQAKVVVGSNSLCFSSGAGGIEYWHYPKGGNPFKTYVTNDPITVVAVSIAK